ncbi:MAG: hypothetical protein EAX87_00450 [Candidatus Thorarchaeota archaeon]|nr:hypothetical protein [Candidatus Thorarchaeota archaeon]
MRGLRRALVKVIVLVPLATLAAAFVIGPGNFVSYTPATRIGVHAMIAFWIAIPAALSVLAYQEKLNRPNMLLMTALLFPMIVHIGSALRHLLLEPGETVQREPSLLITDLLELSMLAVLLMAACVFIIKDDPQRRQAIPNRLIIIIIVLLPLIVYGLISLLVVDFITPTLLNDMSWVLCSISVVCFLLIALMIPKIKKYGFQLDSGYLISSVLLFSIAAALLLSTLPDPTANWEYPETLQMAAYVLLALAMGVPFLRQQGYNRKFAYGIVIGLILIAYLPFLLTITIEKMSLTSPPPLENLLAYSIIHLGAASLSIMMAILLYVYPKRKENWNHYPLILLFGMWAGVAIALVVRFLLSESLQGEPVTPITVGSLLTIGLLYLTIRWTRTPPIKLEKVPSAIQLLLVILGLVGAIELGEIVNQVAIGIWPSIGTSPLSSIVIVGSNLFIMFAFAYIIFMLAEGSKGKPPVELYVLFFLNMWILPNTLKGYYVAWTPGWWISEVLLFVGLLAGPPLLIWLYVRSMHQVEDSHRRANMYADLLMHDVSNYNQMMMMSLELLGSNDLTNEKRKRLAEDGRQVISFSEQLISNVRLLSEADNLKLSELQPTNLVDTIVSALDIFTRRIGSGELIVEFQSEEYDAYVMANDLLVHIFLNILYSALECRKRGETVRIAIHEAEYSGQSYWEIDIKAPGRRADEQDGYSSGTLGLLAAELMTESLNGQFSKETYARTDVCEGRLFTIRLLSKSN